MHVFQFEVEDLIAGIDKDGDGRIQKAELLTFMCFCFGIRYQPKSKDDKKMEPKSKVNKKMDKSVAEADFEGSSSSEEESSSGFSEDLK